MSTRPSYQPKPRICTRVKRGKNLKDEERTSNEENLELIAVPSTSDSIKMSNMQEIMKIPQMPTYTVSIEGLRAQLFTEENKEICEYFTQQESTAGCPLNGTQRYLIGSEKMCRLAEKELEAAKDRVAKEKDIINEQIKVCRKWMEYYEKYAKSIGYDLVKRPIQ